MREIKITFLTFLLLLSVSVGSFYGMSYILPFGVLIEGVSYRWNAW